MHFKKEHIQLLLKRIVKYCEENLNELSKLSIDPNNETNSFYWGLILRQHSLCNDLSILFEYKKTDTELTSEFILFRCLTDDFIHITYIINQPDIDEAIISINADAISKNFKKIAELTELNETKLGGSYPFYFTTSLLEDLKEKLKKSPNRQQHFTDKDNFRFKSFPNTGNIIRDLDSEPYAHQLTRAYFIWRKLSDFVHYSNFTFEEGQDIELDKTYPEFAEIIGYSYYNVFYALSHFQKTISKYEIIDSQNLAEYYKDSLH